MIKGRDCNRVFFSGELQRDPRFVDACNRITAILQGHGITPEFLEGTNDIWCRDYMPIQIDQDRFVQFRYEPSYLKEDPEHQSDPKKVCKMNGFEPYFSDINLDGGNVVNWADRVILTDRVFSENPQYSGSQLIHALEKLFEAEVIIIPSIHHDYTGHADGMVRFIDRSTLIGNSLEDEYKYWSKGMKKILKEHQIDYIDVPFFEHKDKNYPDTALGCYVNFLEVSDLILYPVFEIQGNRDQEVSDLYRSVFKDRTIETININEIGVFGGLLNCISWTIKTDLI